MLGFEQKFSELLILSYLILVPNLSFHNNNENKIFPDIIL